MTQQITVDSTGTYSVIITDENGCTDADHIEVDVISGISEGIAIGAISVYPNLVTDFVMISFKSLPQGLADIRVFDLKGKETFKTAVETVTGQFKIDFTHFPSGMYIVKVALENGVVTEKVVKVK